jgi:hypothetical protein
MTSTHNDTIRSDKYGNVYINCAAHGLTDNTRDNTGWHVGYCRYLVPELSPSLQSMVRENLSTNHAWINS